MFFYNQFSLRHSFLEHQLPTREHTQQMCHSHPSCSRTGNNSSLHISFSKPSSSSFTRMLSMIPVLHCAFPFSSALLFPLLSIPVSHTLTLVFCPPFSRTYCIVVHKGGIYLMHIRIFFIIGFLALAIHWQIPGLWLTKTLTLQQKTFMESFWWLILIKVTLNSHSAQMLLM